jgi:hypothetical protein
MTVNAEFTLVREPAWDDEGKMSIRRDSRAITRGAGTARPGAALILRGLLLLSVP